MLEWHQNQCPYNNKLMSGDPRLRNGNHLRIKKVTLIKTNGENNTNCHALLKEKTENISSVETLVTC